MSDSESPLLSHSIRPKRRNRRDFEDMLPYDNKNFRLILKIARYVLPLFFAFYIEILYLLCYIFLLKPYSIEISDVKQYLLLFFNLIFLLTFLIASFSDPGSLEKALAKYPFDPSFINSLPKCPECNLPKPARCHHCKTCGRCHLRMDHHCPVIGQCVGLGNHQKFIVMLLWASIFTFYASYVILSIHTINRKDTVYRFVFAFIALAMFITTFSFYINHLYMISKNITTIEKLQKTPNIYNKGIRNNFKQIFGSNPIWFFIPRNKTFITGFEFVSDYVQWDLANNEHVVYEIPPENTDLLNSSPSNQNNNSQNTLTYFENVPENNA